MDEKVQNRSSPTGNRTRVSRVTGGGTDLYTIEDWIIWGMQMLPVSVALVVNGIWRVSVRGPLQYSGLALLTLKRQRSLIGAERPVR